MRLFLLSRYRSNASVLILQNAFTDALFLCSDERTINRYRRTSSGAKRNTTKNTESGAVTTFTTFSSPANEKVDAYKVGDSTNIKWHEGSVDVQTREKTMGQKGCVLWFTGLSGSGKSTVAYTLEHELFKRGNKVVTLDGDNIRHGLNSNLGFTAEDREEKYSPHWRGFQVIRDAG